MAKWFRSEPMEYISLIMNEDAAHDCLADLGKMGVIQFTDLNPDLTPFQRRYVTYVKRCDELERKLRFFNIEIDKFKLETTPAASNIDTFLDKNVGTTKKTGDSSGGSAYIKVLEDELEIYDKQLRELNSYNEKLTNEFNEKVEYQEVLEKCAEFYKFDNNTDGDLKKIRYYEI